MREGETATVRLETMGGRCYGTWYATLRIMESGGCDDTSCGSTAYCDYLERDQTANYTAPQDGWVIIVADGSHASDDYGDYRLTVNLTCRREGCECP